MRLRRAYPKLIKWVVSIHASVKDATSSINSSDRMTSFNPRICKRCDPIILAPRAGTIVSIHASVKDATWRNSWAAFYLSGFNPRICKRCDCRKDKHSRRQKVSIHASVKDATNPCNPSTGCARVSIHASVKDATSSCFHSFRENVFQSTHL